MNTVPASALSAQAKALAKPHPITGVDGRIRGIETHAYLTFENATPDDCEKATMKECLDNMSYGHTIPVLFEHNEGAVLGQWTKLFRSAVQPFEKLRNPRLLLDGTAELHSDDQIADKDLYHKVQDDIRRGALLRVSVGMLNVPGRKVITEISLVVSGKEPLAKMYKLLFSAESGKKEVRLRSNIHAQVMATESTNNDALRRLIEKAGGEEQLVKIIESQSAFVENQVKKFGDRVSSDLKSHKTRIVSAFPESAYAKPLIEFLASSLKDPSSEPVLETFNQFMDDIDKLNKRRLELETSDKAKTDEWTATSGKMQAEFEATKAELAKAQEQIARFQGSAQDAAKNKRPSSEMAKPAAQPAAQPVAQPAMPWTQSLQAIEVKQSNPFVSDLWGHNRQGTAKESAEIFQLAVQEALARMPK